MQWPGMVSVYAVLGSHHPRITTTGAHQVGIDFSGAGQGARTVGQVQAMFTAIIRQRQALGTPVSAVTLTRVLLRDQQRGWDHGLGYDVACATTGAT
jgi:hypothetical protein